MSLEFVSKDVERVFDCCLWVLVFGFWIVSNLVVNVCRIDRVC